MLVNRAACILGKKVKVKKIVYPTSRGRCVEVISIVYDDGIVECQNHLLLLHVGSLEKSQRSWGIPRHPQLLSSLIELNVIDPIDVIVLHNFTTSLSFVAFKYCKFKRNGWKKTCLWLYYTSDMRAMRIDLSFPVLSTSGYDSSFSFYTTSWTRILAVLSHLSRICTSEIC